MPLIAYNVTDAPVELAAGRSPGLPPSAAPPARGEGVNVTSELRPDKTVDSARGLVGGLDAADYAAIKAQIDAETIALEWTADPEYLTASVIPGIPSGDTHGLGDIAAHSSATLDELNALIPGVVLDDIMDPREPLIHGLGDTAKHATTTIAQFNKLLSDANLDDVGTERPPIVHGFADATRHSPANLAEVSALVSDAELDGAAEARVPEIHGLGDIAAHSMTTLAELNDLIDGDNLDASTASRTPIALSVVPSSVALANADGLAPSLTIHKAFVAGAGGSPDDVVIYSSNAPFTFRILDSQVAVETTVAASTLRLRDAVGGGGSTLSDAFDSATAGRKRDAGTTATAVIASAGTLVLRRSDDGVAGEVTVLIHKA